MTPRHFIADSPERLRRIVQEIVALQVSAEHPVEVVVRAPRKEKTTAQRGLWHAIIGDIAEATGYTPGHVKNLLKAEFYGLDRVRLPDGYVFDVLASSEAEDRGGYSKLIDWTYQFCAEHGVNINDRRPR